MSESGAKLNISDNSNEDGDLDLQPRPRTSVESKESSCGDIAMLDKTEEFFQICDSEGKGFITSTDMRRLHQQLPLTADELENVFDSLDLDKNGCLTLGEFSSGFCKFLHGRRISVTEDLILSPSQNVSGDLHQSQWDEFESGNEDEEERHFSMLMDSNVFEDPSEVRSLWTQLRKDEPHLLSNFEEFLARVTYQIKEAQQERKEIEGVLKRNAATHDNEICRLYEEMEQQINNEKDKRTLKDSESLHLRSHDLQQQLQSKEQDLEQLFQKQRRLEGQCRELHSEHQESRLENVKLKLTNEELSHELAHTCQELTLAQEQLGVLQGQASRLQQEKEMEMYRITEGLQREKESLMKQLDLLREVDTEEVTHRSNRKSVAHGRYTPFTTGDDGKVEVDRRPDNVPGDTEAENVGEDTPPDGWPLRRVISIEEDPLPHMLQGDTNLLLHQLSEEDEERGREEKGQADLVMSSSASLASADSPPPVRVKKPSKKKWIKGNMPSSARGQPVGKETLRQSPVEGAAAAPQRLFKLILVGNSNVGKTALLRRFCDGHFHSATSATVGMDYSVRTLNLGDCHVALQLWDTAGQERFRSITKQFFRKADGVVIIYDITVEDSFRSVRPWLASIQEAVGDPIPIMLLGNKSDRDDEREVQMKEAEMLAQGTRLMFSECSAYTGDNVVEAMTHLAK
ncbi:Ras and EF-hand domain-containing protein [Triplophysa tibetana]|uniref:Ras and EF-hand domain-containing protein n=1 Tax=Triplophysa tibetana TaxID=1572043 RepID=A0A5A9PI89_9TELE|nr:Ras and EF-hand domain-containing protein [Triplophysa tibetana]